MPIDLLNAALPQTFDLEKMQYLQSAMKQGMPIVPINIFKGNQL